MSDLNESINISLGGGGGPLNILKLILIDGTGTNIGKTNGTPPGINDIPETNILTTTGTTLTIGLGILPKTTGGTPTKKGRTKPPWPLNINSGTIILGIGLLGGGGGGGGGDRKGLTGGNDILTGFVPPSPSPPPALSRPPSLPSRPPSVPRTSDWVFGPSLRHPVPPSPRHRGQESCRQTRPGRKSR